jgi:hypothetical protein
MRMWIVSASLLVLGVNNAPALTLDCFGGLTQVCPQLNAAGTPTEVALQFTANLTGTLTIENPHASPLEGEATLNILLDLMNPLPGFNAPSPLLTITAPTGLLQIPSGGQQTVNIAGNGSVTLVNTSVFDPYVGGGTFTVPIATSEFPTANFNLPHGSLFPQWTLTGHAVVIYTVAGTPVPEPTSVVLLTTGLLAVLWRRPS